MTTTIARWGNSVGIRLSKSVLEDAHLREGDQVSVALENGRLVIVKKHRLEDLLELITPENLHGEAVTSIVGNEAW